MQELEKMTELIEEANKNAEKFYNKGNKAAGVRLRKNMQEIKIHAQDIRKNVSDTNKS